MDEFLGKKYALKTSDDFEDYLTFIGKNYFQRKASLNLSQENWLTRNATGAYTFHFNSPFAESKTTFIPGEEVEETRPDGVKVTFKQKNNLRQENWLTGNATRGYTFHFSSPYAESKTTFIPGEEVEETRPDGVKVKALITIEDNKMIHTQTEENGRVSKHVRVFSPNSMTVMTHYTTVYGAEKTATRHYVAEAGHHEQ